MGPREMRGPHARGRWRCERFLPSITVYGQDGRRSTGIYAQGGPDRGFMGGAEFEGEGCRFGLEVVPYLSHRLPEHALPSSA